MSGFKSGEAARLLVQVSSLSEIGLRRHCPRCRLQRLFVSSGKFRVNAQKKRLDAWLIFRCSVCDDRWNWPVHERRPVGALDPRELDALMRNDPALAARHAQAALGQGVGGTRETSLAVTVVQPAGAETNTIEIVVAVAGASLRLDRLLAQVLSIGRAEIEALSRAVTPSTPKALRRPARDGQQIRIDLGLCSEDLAARLRRAVQAPDL